MAPGISERRSHPYIWCMLKRLHHVCNKTKQRRCVWLVCMFIVTIFVVCLPFRLDISPSSKVIMAPSVAQKSLSIDYVLEQTVETILRQKMTNYSMLMQEFSATTKKKNDKKYSFLNSYCKDNENVDTELFFPSMSLIVSIHNILSEVDVFVYLRHNFEYFVNNVTDDVIITAQDSLPLKVKNVLEDVLDLCNVCRLFFFPGNIYQHRNEASKFAHYDYLLFVDARVLLTKSWFQPLLKCLRDDPSMVVSPQLRLNYADGSGHNEGLSRNEITWDLGVRRGPVTDSLLASAQSLGLTYIKQSLISTEIFGIRKKFFSYLGGFDIVPDVTGGEHVTFSLKVLNCGGSIVSSLCSSVFLNIFNDTQKYEIYAQHDSSNQHTEFTSLTFIATQNNLSGYYVAGSKPWLDSFTEKYYACASKRQINESTLTQKSYANMRRDVQSQRLSEMAQSFKSRYGSYGSSLTRHLILAKCQVHNLRYIINELQPNMIIPTKYATYYGYIRSMDGMYAFGMRTNSSIGLQELDRTDSLHISTWGNFILTRNTSMWLGPFSFTNGAFIYNNVWCITVGKRLELTLTKCIKGNSSQLFVYANNIIRPFGINRRSACAKKSADVSNEISMVECPEFGYLKHFKFDVEFIEKCIK